MKHPTPPKINDGTSLIRLSAKEFEALMERGGVSAPILLHGSYYFTILPISFWIPRDEWEGHLLKGILHNCAAKWKDVLTEPTLQKIRALLPAASPAAQGADAPETC